MLSDTHIPNAAVDMPAKVYVALEGVDLILHAGDMATPEALEKIEGIAKVKAVRGNMDRFPTLKELPIKSVVEIGGVRIGLIHGYGPPHDLADRIGHEFEDVDAIVFGHTHRPMNEVRNGVLYFNPGSPTDKIFSASNTFGILTIKNKKLTGEIVII